MRETLSPVSTRFAQHQAIAVNMADYARLRYLAGGIEHAADSSLRADAAPLFTARIDARQLPIAPRSLRAPLWPGRLLRSAR